MKFTAQASVFDVTFRKEWVKFLTWAYERSLGIFTLVKPCFKKTFKNLMK